MNRKILALSALAFFLSIKTSFSDTELMAKLVCTADLAVIASVQRISSPAPDLTVSTGPYNPVHKPARYDYFIAIEEVLGGAQDNDRINVTYFYQREEVSGFATEDKTLEADLKLQQRYIFFLKRTGINQFEVLRVRNINDRNDVSQAYNSVQCP